MHCACPNGDQWNLFIAHGMGKVNGKVGKKTHTVLTNQAALPVRKEKKSPLAIASPSLLPHITWQVPSYPMPPILHPSLTHAFAACLTYL
eukprot:1159652-Pelagomonas_calceolata.AAC.20